MMNMLPSWAAKQNNRPFHASLLFEVILVVQIATTSTREISKDFHS